MNRIDKEALIASVKARFEAAPFLALVDYKGSSVLQLQELRRACEPHGVHLQVVKNSLSKRAVVDTEKASLKDSFNGPVALLFAGDDPIAAAKVLRDQMKTNENLQVTAGFFEGDVLDAKGVAAVASLASREELLVKMLQTLQAAPRQLMGVMQGPARDLLYLLKNYETKLSE